MRRRVLTAICALAVVAGGVIVYAVAARFVLHGPVNTTSLATAVTAAAPSMGDQVNVYPRCRALGRDLWRCNVLDSEGSGSATYRVAVRAGNSCWRAQRVADHSERGMPHHLSGCVHRWQWSAWDLLN